jgi:ATP-binding cassette, subfamily B, bacterial
MSTMRPPSLLRARELIEASIRSRATPRGPRRGARPPVVTARLVARAEGREHDAGYVSFLAGLAETTSPRGDEQVTGVGRLAGLLAGPAHRTAARRVLRGFVADSLTRGTSRTSAYALAQALDALAGPAPEGPARPFDPDGPGMARPDRGTILAAVRPRRRQFGFAAAASFVYSLSTVGVALLFGAIAQRLWADQLTAGPADTRLVLLLAVAGAALFVARGLAASRERLEARRMQIGLAEDQRQRLATRLSELPPTWHRRQDVHELINTIDVDTRRAWRPVTALTSAIGATFVLVLTLATLTWIDWRVGVIGLVTLLLLAATNVLYLRSVTAHVQRARTLRADIVEISRGPARAQPFAVVSGQLRRSTARVRVIRGLFDSVLAVIPAVGALASIAVIIYRGPFESAVGVATAIAFLFTAVASPLRTVGWALAELPAGAGAAARVARLLADSRPMTFGTATPADGEPTLKFEAVGLAGDDDRPILSDISLSVPPGRLIAVVGEPTAGRSALAMLAARRIDPTTGTVRLASRDLREMSRQSLDRTIAYVPSKPTSECGTVREAVTLGREDIDEEVVWRVLRAVAEDRLVESLGEGLDAPASAWARGVPPLRRNRLLLAGALAGGPKLLVLDSCHGGAEFDPSLLTALRGGDEEMTIMVVTNEASTIVSSDEVVYLGSDGRVTARSHPTLLRSDKSYARLFAHYRTRPYPTAPGRPRANDGPEPAAETSPIDLLAGASQMLPNRLRKRAGRRTGPDPSRSGV